MGMKSYAALLRGIGPGNPNMHGDKLRTAFEAAGFTKVRTLLASGNLVFESEMTDANAMESLIETTIVKELGFTTTAFVLSSQQIQNLIDANPFGNLNHENSGKTYLTVTYFKDPPQNLPDLPFKPVGKTFQLVANIDGALCGVVDLTQGKTPDLMVWLERQYGKQITTRTLLTMNRILAKLRPATP